MILHMEQIKKLKNKINIESLCANDSVITCLANDTGYENIYSEQIKVKGKKMTN